MQFTDTATSHFWGLGCTIFCVRAFIQIVALLATCPTGDLGSWGLALCNSCRECSSFSVHVISLSVFLIDQVSDNIIDGEVLFID